MSDDAAVWLDHHEKVVGALKAENAQLRQERDGFRDNLKACRELRDVAMADNERLAHEACAAREALREAVEGNKTFERILAILQPLAASPAPTPALDEPCTCHFGCCAKCCGNQACPTHAKSTRLSPGPREQVARSLCASCDSQATRRDPDGYPRCNLCGPRGGTAPGGGE